MRNRFAFYVALTVWNESFKKPISSQLTRKQCQNRNFFDQTQKIIPKYDALHSSMDIFYHLLFIFFCFD